MRNNEGMATAGRVKIHGSSSRASPGGTMSLIIVFTTLPTREQALALARELVDKGCVACAQISAIDSLYRWEGAIQQEPEYRLMLKACADQYEAIEATILAHHPYELPAIHALAVARVYEPYGEWIQATQASAAADALS